MGSSQRRGIRWARHQGWVHAGQRDPATDVTGDDPLMTGKIALANLREFPDYYTRLVRMEAEAEGGAQGSVRAVSDSLPAAHLTPGSAG
jgi:Protein of unknown function (DUF5661)